MFGSTTVTWSSNSKYFCPQLDCSPHVTSTLYSPGTQRTPLTVISSNRLPPPSSCSFKLSAFVMKPGPDVVKLKDCMATRP